MPTTPHVAPYRPANLRVARFEDYPQIEKLESGHSLLTLSTKAWRHIWVDNPLLPRLGDTWPVGWVLEDAEGRIVGSMANVPTAYTYRGRDLIAATGRAWVVLPEYRGIALWIMEEYYQQTGVDLFLCNTVNALAVAAFTSLESVRVPLGNWESAAYWVTSYRGFAAAALKIKQVPLAGLLGPPAAAALKLRDVLRKKPVPSKTASVEIAAADGFDSRFDAFWNELVSQNPTKLLSVRDSKTLSWHFAASMWTGQAWILTASRNGLLRAYAVFKRQDHQPSGLRRMRLVDYQTLEPKNDLLSSLLHHALRRCAAEEIHTLEHVGCDLPKMRSFDALAPYRRRLLSWPFYYNAPNSSLAAELRNPEVWDPSSYDGDASL
jgi:hypothetical protein